MDQGIPHVPEARFSLSYPLEMDAGQLEKRAAVLDEKPRYEVGPRHEDMVPDGYGT